MGEAGVGKSRLVHEVTHSHRLHGWLVLESAAVSYGKGTSYRPVIDLLRSYFRIQERDDHREIREKVTGKLLILDDALRPTGPGSPAGRPEVAAPGLQAPAGRTLRPRLLPLVQHRASSVQNPGDFLGAFETAGRNPEVGELAHEAADFHIPVEAK